jgi:hypothetical protein
MDPKRGETSAGEGFRPKWLQHSGQIAPTFLGKLSAVADAVKK